MFLKEFVFERFVGLEKRFVLLIVLIFVGFAVWRGQSSTQDISKFVSPIGQKVSFMEAEKKLGGNSDWKPVGWGSGEYLKTIPIIGAGAVVDMDSGRVIWSMNLNARIAPASLSKLATTMTALDIADPEKKLMVSEDAARQIPTKLGLKTGDKLTLSEAIYASLMTSANDAAETISDALGKEIGSGTSSFEELVNVKLAKLGAVDSHFVTSTGLDSENHYSTVFDLAIIAHSAKVDYPLISDAAGTSYKKLNENSDHKVFDLPNWNALLGIYPGVNGLKIGYTEDSGHSTIVTSSRDNKNLMAIVIGEKSLEDREIAAATLLNYGFEKSGISGYPVASLDLTARFADWHRQLTQGGP